MINDSDIRLGGMKRRLFLQRLAGLMAMGGCASKLVADEIHKTYRIQKGDTLSELAEKHGTTASAIRKANGLKNDRIIAGQRLLIPVKPRGVEDFESVTRALRVPRDRWKFVVAHHSATPNGNAAIYGRNHYRRGMRDGLAYHFVIGNGIDSGDGEIEVGPRWRKQLRGGHVKSPIYNQYGIGICFVGNFMKTRPTDNQISSFHRLMETLASDVLGTNYSFTVHKLIRGEQTACPGRYFPTDALLSKYTS